MNTQTLVIALSSLELTMVFEDAPEAYRAMHAVWRRAERTRPAATVHRLTYRAARQVEGYVLELEGEPPRRLAMEEDIALAIDTALYPAFLRTQHQDGVTVLHASAAAHGRRTVVFAGVSGAGKSALARAAVDAGLSYLGDELIVATPEQLWGVPRSIHMDPHPEDMPRHPWHSGADMDSYRCRNAGGRWYRVPLVPIAQESVQQTPLPIREAVLVELCRGDHDAVTRSSAASRLALLERAHFVRGPALASLALTERALRLTWSHPQKALAQLLRTLEGG